MEDNKEIMNPTNQPVSFYGDNSRSTDSALLAALATKDNYAPALDSISATGIGDARDQIGDLKCLVKDAEADIRREISKSEADIRADILKEGQDNMAATKDAQCQLSKDILETRHTLAKDILRSEYESKLAVQAAIKEINTKVDHEAERTNDFVRESRNFNAEKFCQVENLIKENRTKALEDKVLQQSQDIQTGVLLRNICCGCTETSKK